MARELLLTANVIDGRRGGRGSVSSTRSGCRRTLAMRSMRRIRTGRAFRQLPARDAGIAQGQPCYRRNTLDDASRLEVVSTRYASDPRPSRSGGRVHGEAQPVISRDLSARHRVRLSLVLSRWISRNHTEHVYTDLLKGKKILITAAAPASGRASGMRYLELGAELVICGRRKAVLDATADEFRAADPGAHVATASADVRDAGFGRRR